jgi:LysR family transcriptional regulator (chromosome initiation inhibitor)
MTLLDYKGIEALYTVQQLQSFEAAAQKLHITQSAVSQRIKGLETFYGKPVLTRTLPYRPTELGSQLIGHFTRLCLLERDLQQEIGKMSHTPRISIALNRDSLETWFLDLVEETEIIRNISLEIVTDDQELTLEYLKSGLVSACLSTSEREIQGGRVQFLGDMEYILVASHAFVKKYFSKGNAKENLRNAPAIKFDQNDKLHERYLEKFFDLDGRELNYHVIPSVDGFKKFTLSGYGYALIPKMDVVNELKEDKLLQIHSDKTWKVPLYWHYWAIESKFYQKFNADIADWAKSKFRRI